MIPFPIPLAIPRQFLAVRARAGGLVERLLRGGVDPLLATAGSTALMQTCDDEATEDMLSIFLDHHSSSGEKFDLEKHPQGTEVKAITYSAMQIHEKADRCDLYVIVDI